MRHVSLSISGVAVLFTMLAASASGQPNTESIVERNARFFSDPDEYYFFEDDRKQVVDYRRDRVVRICAGNSRHLVPLLITADERSLRIGTGDCISVEAQRVFLEPAEPLEGNSMIIAKVQTTSD